MHYTIDQVASVLAHTVDNPSYQTDFRINNIVFCIKARKSWSIAVRECLKNFHGKSEQYLLSDCVIKIGASFTTLKLRKGTSGVVAFLIFSTGTITVSGVTNATEIKQCLHLFSSCFTPSQKPIFKNPRVCNITANCSLPGELDRKFLADLIGAKKARSGFLSVHLNTERFPATFISFAKFRGKAAVYKSRKACFIGFKSKEYIIEALILLKKCLKINNGTEFVFTRT